ncbi:hypothetical protein BS47DRAFT_1302713, partial [Hydnum rufescens UP504]
GEGFCTLSWIWVSQGVGDNPDVEMHEGIIRVFTLRVEWAKSRARKDRWCEEVLLLEEEMRWVIAFCEWQAERWVERASSRGGAAPGCT